MKKVIAVLVVLCTVEGISQVNLVPNPSFEQHSGCPNNLDEVYMSNGWSSYLGTPDYLHRCATNSNLTIPNNYFGYQEPTSLSDSAYCAIATLSIGPFGREAVGCQLSNPLVIGAKYYVSVAVTAASNPASSVQCFTNNLGLLFSTVQFSAVSPAPINNFAHVFTNNIITDTSNWTLITGSFIADSAYQYVSVGNFFDDQNTDTLNCTGSYAYYFLDYVCVSTDTLTCNWDVGVPHYSTTPRMNIYPNPADESVNITCEGRSDIELLDAQGNCVFQSSCMKNCSVDLMSFPNGIYLLRLNSMAGSITRKLIVNH